MSDDVLLGGEPAPDAPAADTSAADATASDDAAKAAADDKSDDTKSDDKSATAADDKPPAKADEKSDDASADKTDDKAEAKDEDKGEGAPDEYDLKMPDGIEVDDADLKAFTDFAKDIGLSNEQAQKIIDRDASQQGEVDQQGVDAYEDRIKSWGDATKQDKELGGEAMPENLSVAHKAMEAFKSPGLSELLAKPSEKNPDGLGLGNHPEVIRLFFRIGKAIGDDELHLGGAAPSTDDRLKRMYPTMNQDAS